MVKSKRRNLYLFTDSFPFGKGEKSFIIPEIEALQHRYDITVVTEVSEELKADSKKLTALNDNIRLIVIDLPLTYPRKLVYILYGFLFFLASLGWEELHDIGRDGFSFYRLIDSVKQFALAKRFNRLCGKRGVFKECSDSIYYSFWFSTSALLLTLEKRKNPSLVAISRAHGYDLYNERNAYGRQPFQRIMRDSMNRLLFVSSTSEDYFIESFGIESFPGQYRLNRLGVDGSVSPRNDIQDSARYIVSCSNVIKLKRVDLLAKALCLLLNQNIKWIHFGDGSEICRVKQISDEKGLNAVFAGYVSNEKISKFYQTHNVLCFVHVSSSEGLPMSIQEALAASIPIVATDVGGVSETIDGNGILLPANPTLGEIADAVKSIITASPDEWMRMSNRSYKLWERRFNLQKCKQQLLNILEEL